MSTKFERGRRGGQARDKLYISLARAPFEELERAFLAFERERLKTARSDSERLEVKRRTAENILLGASDRRCSWEEFNRALQRIQRLGYTDVITRCEVAARFALSTSSFPEQVDEARKMLDEAERRLRFVRKDNGLRKAWMKEIGRIRRMAGWQGAAIELKKARRGGPKR